MRLRRQQVEPKTDPILVASPTPKRWVAHLPSLGIDGFFFPAGSDFRPMRVRIPDEGNTWGDGNDSGHTLGKCGRGEKGPPGGMAMGDQYRLLDSDFIEDRNHVVHHFGWSVTVSACRAIRESIAAPIEGDNAVVSSEVVNLALPTAGVGDRRGWDQ